MIRRFGVLVVLLVCLSVVPAQLVVAEDEPVAAPAPAGVSVATAAPSTVSDAAAVTPDTDVFRRTPVIDGVVDDGEWDTFYASTSGDWRVTTYVDWDSGAMYIGAKSSKPVDLLSVLDANADGWFHGDENYEFRASRAEDGGVTLVVCRYDSRNTKSPMAAPVSAAEASMVQMKSTRSGEWHMIEMRVPTGLIRGYKLGAGKKIGFKIAVRTTNEESGWIPTSQLGDVSECTLVVKKVATLKPLVVDWDLKDSRIARGEDLVGRFHLANTGSESLDVNSFVIAGEGKSGDYLSSQRIRIEGLAPGQHVGQDVRTLVPSDMPLGCWAIGAEVSSGSARLGAALASFEVVDPFDVELRLPPGDVSADVKDVSFGVSIRNNTRHSLRGRAKISLPVGWELWRNADTREFRLSGNEAGAVNFKAKPPIGEMGTVPVTVEVTSGREVKIVEGKISVVNPK